jgi:aspartate kinase
MSLIVQKFGGTSVGSIERIQHVAKKIEQEVRKGNQPVVVVSAMGNSTDFLVEMAKQISPDPTDREMDMLLTTGEQITISLLAMALSHLHIEAVSMTGWQAGMITDAVHRDARIIEINKEKILSQTGAGKVVVVAGFQGVTIDGQITTLGRGGSDITAVALAAALDAERCDIFTDVSGVFTADPRIVPSARKMKQISFDEMLELAQLGAEVLHPRAVEWAKNHHVALTVRSSFEETEGTWIKEDMLLDEGWAVCGVTYELLENDLAKVSIVGIGVASNAGTKAKMIRCLSDVGIEVKTVFASKMSISGVVPQSDMVKAVQSLHHTFYLDLVKEKAQIIIYQ